MASRARWNGFTGRIWPAGRSLETPGLDKASLLNLDWIRAVNHLKILDPGQICTELMEKKCSNFWGKSGIFHIFWTLFGFGLFVWKIFGLCLDLDRVLTNQDWTWIAKYDSLPISEAEVVTYLESSEISDLLLYVSLQGCSRDLNFDTKIKTWSKLRTIIFVDYAEIFLKIFTKMLSQHLSWIFFEFRAVSNMLWLFLTCRYSQWWV